MRRRRGYRARMHEQRVRGKFTAQKRFYTELKAGFGLSAQPAIRVIGKVADAYTTLRQTRNIRDRPQAHPFTGGSMTATTFAQLTGLTWRP
jgi:hypothetical protein